MEKTTSNEAPPNPATMNLSQQYALASSLRPGQTLLPAEVRLIVQRESYNAQHKGHESKHAMMFLIFVGVLAMMPSIVKFWRQRYPTSYKLVSIGSISLIPPYFALGNGFYRFVVIWLVYASASVYVLYLATRQPLHVRTPRRVYQWFALTNKVSYAVFVMGFVLFLLGFFNIAPGLTDSEAYLSASMLFLFYGLYFGLMSRDLVALCTDRIAATLGYSSSEHNLPTKTLPRDVCCICGDVLGSGGSGDSSNSSSDDVSSAHEPTHVLSCRHEFHATCIRGWCVVGKKDVCPFCREKVDLELFKRNPWDKQELFYVTAVEYMRFFVSWQPLTVLFLTGIYWMLGLD